MNGITFDDNRAARIGLPEAVFCQGKPRAALVDLLTSFGRGGGSAVLFTRLAPEIVEDLPEEIRQGIDYHELSRTAWGQTLPARGKGRVAVVSAGTADGSVTWEAARTLAYLGVEHSVYEDCGVAGLWRLLDRLPEINGHDVVIVVAGLDAALASVLGGMTPKPLLAVPTSVGYGVSNQGQTALQSMLVSCAPGVPVFNVDNGYGAACAAVRILGLL